MVSLNDVTKEVDEKYGPFVVEDVEGGDVVLRNPLRLTENERHRLTELEAELKAHKGDVNGVLKSGGNLLRLVSVGDGGDRLLDAMGDDATKLMRIIELYGEATQLGEASRSES